MELRQGWKRQPAGTGPFQRPGKQGDGEAPDDPMAMPGWHRGL